MMSAFEILFELIVEFINAKKCLPQPRTMNDYFFVYLRKEGVFPDRQ